VPIAPDVTNPVPGPSPQALAAGVYLNTGWLPPRTKQGPGVAARSYTYDVTAPGRYTYVCVLHRSSGMVGVLDVRS
jgi:plastocyanin